MTIAQRRAPRSFRASLPDPAYWFWRKLTSVRWAIGLILVAALASGVGVVIPQVPPQFAGVPERVEEHVEAQRPTWGPVTDVLADFPWFYETNGGVFNLFNQPYWYALVGLVAVAISVCTVSRAPPIWRTFRRPPKRVNAAYFERARHRFAADLPDGTGAETAAESLASALESRRFRVSRVPVPSIAAGDSDAQSAAASGPPVGDSAVLLFADRHQWAQLATFATHIALLLLLGATLVTKFAGEEYQFWVAEGESRPLFAAGAERAQVQIIVDDVIARFADDGQALDFRSVVQVAEGGREAAAGEVTVNGPLLAAGYRVHQASYWEHGAQLNIYDAETQQLVYAEAHFLAGQTVAPRVRIERSGALLSEEAIGLQHGVAAEPDASEARRERAAGSAYTVIPLFADRSLALVLAPGAASGDESAPLEFWYRIVANRPEGYAGMTLTDLGVDAESPPAPDILLTDSDGEVVYEGAAPLEQEIDADSRLTRALPIGEDLAVGLRGSPQPAFFYYSFSAESDRGQLAAGESAELAQSGLRLTFRGLVPDQSRQGSLAAGETRQVGAIELTFLGAESVFYEAVPDLPGAAGAAVIALERFGQARTAETFDARGGENVRLAVSTVETSAGGQASRPARLVLGLGGAGGRIELDEGERANAAGYVYEFAGPREFTGLNVRRDPGAIAFWIGVGLGIAGMTATFFAPRRRVWVRIAEGRASLAGQAGHGVRLSRELRAICAAAGLIADDEPETRRESGGRFGDDYRRAGDGGG